MEEEKRHRVSRSNNGPNSITTVDGGGEMIECSGKLWRSCTAGLIADCVALCCCPCAVVHCFALAFVKAPWVMGKRCLGLKSKKKVKSKRKCMMGSDDEEDLDSDVEEGNKLKKVASSNSANNVGEIMESVCGVNAGFEAEKVWLELYQIRHLDFGRVSFSHDH